MFLFVDNIGSKEVECRRTFNGEEYRGIQNVTVEGRTCIRWDQHYHSSVMNPTTLGVDYLFDAMNFCRNPPGTMDQPWCYTTDPDKEHEDCHIPMCGNYTLSSLLDRRRYICKCICM